MGPGLLANRRTWGGLMVRETIEVATGAREVLVDITIQVKAVVARSGIGDGLSTWQNIFLCEFDGPRSTRRIVCTVMAG
jgi:thiamine phosphate synthase YjbQ (UPF0047 family)